MARLAGPASIHQNAMIAAIAPDPQQRAFILGFLRQLRRVRRVPDLLAID